MVQHPVGTELEGEVKNITEFGLFVGLPGDIDGMVHLSDLDWSQSGEEAVKDYAKGQNVKVKVLDIDIDKERISLGVKQLTDDPFGSAVETLKKGATVTGTVTQVGDKGIEVEVGEGLIGFIRKADLSRDRSEQRPERFAVGERIDATVTTLDKKSRRVTLSIKQREIQEEKQAMAEYGSSDSGASLGDILGAAISKAAQEKQARGDEPAAEAVEAEPEPEPEEPAEEAKAKEPAKKAKPAKKKAAKAKAEEAEEAAEDGEAEQEAG